MIERTYRSEVAFNASNSPVVTEEMIRDVARRVVEDPIEARDASGCLTGEWII